MRSITALIALALLATAVQAEDRTPVTGIKPLLITAIDHGLVRGVIVGRAAAFVRQRFETEAPIEIDVKRLHALPRPGCSRLEVTTRQLAVSENGKREDKEFVYQLSYCRDGSFPEKR